MTYNDPQARHIIETVNAEHEAKEQDPDAPDTKLVDRVFISQLGTRGTR